MVSKLETEPCAETQGVLSKVRISLRESFATLQFSKLKGTPTLHSLLLYLSHYFSTMLTHSITASFCPFPPFYPPYLHPLIAYFYRCTISKVGSHTCRQSCIIGLFRI